MKKRMTKLRSKLYVRIFIVGFSMYIVLLLVNKYITPKYHLYKMKKNLSNVCENIKKMDYNDLINNSQKLEYKYNVTIIKQSFDKDSQYFNNSVWDQLYKRGMILPKFKINKTKLANNEIGKIYELSDYSEDGNLEPRFLATVIKKQNTIFIIGLTIPHFSEVIRIVNEFNRFFMILAVVCHYIVQWTYVKNIVQPIEKLKELSEDIAKLNFKKIDVKTGDEIEALGNSINIMSEKLQKSQIELEIKNENLKTFISDISHEIKTPLALIKTYSMGIKDGLDDGTYLDVLVKHSDNISILIDKLLKLSKVEKDAVNESIFDVEELFQTSIEKYKIMIEKQQIIITIKKDNFCNGYIIGDKEKIEMVLNNLISNSIKYTADNKMEINIENINNRVLFSIKNGISYYDEGIKNKIWEPFYVIENSRAKNLSGTGLGLSVVKAILEKHNLEYGVELYKNTIEFYVYFESGIRN